MLIGENTGRRRRLWDSDAISIGHIDTMKAKLPMESSLRILTVRDQRVLLDADLARLYEVETRVLNQAVKRNPDRFPTEFAFPLTRGEILSISQSVTSLGRLKFSKNVTAFTEHGALQAASVVNSPAAVQMGGGPRFGG